MNSSQDLPPPEKPAAPAENPPEASAEPQGKKSSKLPLILAGVGVLILAPAIGLGVWMSLGKPVPVAADPGKPIPPELPAPPAPFKPALASGEASSAPAEEGGLEKTAEKITSIAAALPPDLLLASVDGAAPSRLIVSGNLERSVDAISRIPRHERWEIRIGAGNTSDSYTRQLDYFKIELGVIGQANEITYLSNLSAPNPTAKKQTAEGEKRLYLIWQRGSMREADEEILSRAKIPPAGKVVVHFCPVELENELVKLEDDQAKQTGLKRIRKTVFGVRPREPEGFRFFVIEQKADQ